MARGVVVIAMLFAAAVATTTAAAQPVCSEESVAARAASLGVRDLRLAPSPERSSPCMSVRVLPPELGPPVVARPAGARCALAAVAYRRRVMRSETCGYDVHFEPLIETGVVVFAPRGRRLERVAHGVIDMPRLDLLRVVPTGGGGDDPRGTAFALGERRLVITRRRVTLAPA